MKNKLLKAAGACALSVVAATSFSSAAFAAEGYGAAGCGLGAMIFGDNPSKVKQVMAATTNGTFGSQTFGISTGTSHCSGTDTAGAPAAEAFIQSNREAFAKDVARGNGETIANLSTLAGCADPTQVGTVLQSQFNAIFPTQTTTDQAVSGAVITTLKAHAELSCKSLT